MNLHEILQAKKPVNFVGATGTELTRSGLEAYCAINRSLSQHLGPFRVEFAEFGVDFPTTTYTTNSIYLETYCQDNDLRE